MALANGQRQAAVYGLTDFAEAGGLMSYSFSLIEQHRAAASYIDKIFKGAKPAVLPVKQPTRFVTGSALERQDVLMSSSEHSPSNPMPAFSRWAVPFLAATSLFALVLGLLAPLAAGAQQPAQMRRIGVLMGLAESDPRAQARVAAFRKGLQMLGWAEGRNIRMDIRWATTSDAPAMQRFAKELVALQPDLILSHNTPTTATLLRYTRTIPIVFAVVSDPVGSGFVASFPRPGGNVTGFTNIEPTMASKWLELLKEVAPRVTRVAFLFNPATAPYAESYLGPFKAAAASIAMEAIAAPVRNTSELESAIAAQARTPYGGLVVMTDSFLVTHRAAITALAARHRLPAVYPFRDFIELGGLLFYGNDLLDSFRRAAAYVDRILKGAAPSELPVQAPVKFELVINVKAAKALGLTVPPSLLVRADEVVE